MKYQLTKYIKYITDEEFAMILGYVNHLKSPSMRMCIKVMMYLGLRISEAVALKRDNFNKDFTRMSYVLKKRKPITVKERIVPNCLSIELSEYFRRSCRRIREGYLFYAHYANQSQNPHLQPSSIRFKFIDLRKCLSINDIYYTCIDGKKLYRVSPHTLRHYVAWKIYVASGKDIITTRDIIGHIKTETTARYCRSLDAINNEREIIERAFMPVVT